MANTDHRGPYKFKVTFQSELTPTLVASIAPTSLRAGHDLITVAREAIMPITYNTGDVRAPDATWRTAIEAAADLEDDAFAARLEAATRSRTCAAFAAVLVFEPVEAARRAVEPQRPLGDDAETCQEHVEGAETTYDNDPVTITALAQFAIGVGTHILRVLEDAYAPLPPTQAERLFTEHAHTVSTLWLRVSTGDEAAITTINDALAMTVVSEAWFKALGHAQPDGDDEQDPEWAERRCDEILAERTRNFEFRDDNRDRCAIGPPVPQHSLTTEQVRALARGSQRPVDQLIAVAGHTANLPPVGIINNQTMAWWANYLRRADSLPDAHFAAVVTRHTHAADTLVIEMRLQHGAAAIGHAHTLPTTDAHVAQQRRTTEPVHGIDAAREADPTAFRALAAAIRAQGEYNASTAATVATTSAHMVECEARLEYHNMDNYAVFGGHVRITQLARRVLTRDDN